jgi:hypothetical protein
MKLMAQDVTTDMAESAASQTEFYTLATNQEEESPHEVLNTSETKESYVPADEREHNSVSISKLMIVAQTFSSFLHPKSTIKSWRQPSPKKILSNDLYSS